MNDDVKAAALKHTMARIREALPSAGSTMALQAWEFEVLLAHIDGEDARTAAAVAAAREEQREACADWLDDTVWPEAAYAVVRECRATPLTATPLVDELERSWQTTARMIERAEKAESEVEREKTEHAEALTRLDAWRMRAGTAEAERDALRAQVEAARAAAAKALVDGWRILRAMDGAKPK